MTFDEIFDQIITLLKTQGRVSYGAIKRRFDLDDDYLEDLKTEIIEAQQLAVDENGRIMIWVTDTASTQDQYQAEPTQTQQPVMQDSRVPQTEPLSEPATPDAERRQLTVMFCDLAGSTRLSGQLDPEDLRDVIRAYQATSAEVIERYDGYIAQHLGDGLMVYFGWPQAHEDDAQRAVHAGLGIPEAMAGLNDRLEQEKGIRLAVRIGIHTGLVVVGEIGQGASQEHLALGETPNIASRIEGIADPDTVAVSASTYQLVQGYFVCKNVGLHTLKGIEEPQQAYRVVRESAAQGRIDVAALHGLTPLVGREQEVGLLLERWRQVKDGHGQVVLLSGEAGIGKSRLVQVIKTYVAEESHRGLECRSSPYYRNTPLYPLADLLQRTIQGQADETPAQRLATLEHILSDYGLPLAERVPLLAPLLSLPLPEDRYPSLQLAPQRQRQKTLETLLAMLLEQAERQALLFILEDLHWTDPTTLEWLNLLVEQVPTTSLLIVLTCRPEFQSPWGLRSHLTPIALTREHGFPLYEALGAILRGWALARQGDGAAGTVALRQGMADNKGTGTGITWPWFLAMLAEAGEREPQAGLRALDEALRLVDANQEHWWEAEVYRLKGKLLLHTAGGTRHAALTPEECFQRALDVARQQQAKSLELRAATSLARLWQQQGKHREAHDLLAPVYNWFSEGFDTADLQDARALREELG